MRTPEVELLTQSGCPHGEATAALLKSVVDELAPGTPVTRVEIVGEEHARELAFPGSPTVRVDGRDIAGEPEDQVAPPGRPYGAEGSPPRWMVEAAILRALGLQSYLFLCVANSARSQMAEGIARSFAPEGVTVASAGSEPSGLRSEAVDVLSEVGIDIYGQRSKPVSEVAPETVEVVVTLCAEEVCPVWLGAARRIHWGLPDPAAVGGAARLDAFRSVQDELLHRLGLLFLPGKVPQGSSRDRGQVR